MLLKWIPSPRVQIKKVKIKNREHNTTTLQLIVDVDEAKVEVVARPQIHPILVRFSAKFVENQIMKLLSAGTGMNLPPLDLMHEVTMLVIPLDHLTITLTLVPLLTLLTLTTMVLSLTWTVSPMPLGTLILELHIT
jgi:hypothetical protein